MVVDMKKTLSMFNELGDKTVTKGVCAHCGKQLNFLSYTTDHVTPKSFGGSNSKVNLVLLCYHCNQKKSCKVIFDPRVEYPYLKRKHIMEYCVMMTALINIVRQDKEQESIC